MVTNANIDISLIAEPLKTNIRKLTLSYNKTLTLGLCSSNINV